MNGMFLSVAVENANFRLPRALNLLSKGALANPGDIHQICTLFRQRGVARLLMEGTQDGYHVNTMQSASAFSMELQRTPESKKVTSYAKPWFDAISSGYWECAREIAAHSRLTWNSDYEYEDDFLYTLFLLQFSLFDVSSATLAATLTRYEKTLDGARDVRLDICRALRDSDAEAFDAALRSLLEERAIKVNAMIERKAMSDDVAVWLRHFALEGVALLGIAGRAGIETSSGHLHCPDMLRAASPFEFDASAWRDVTFEPRRA